MKTLTAYLLACGFAASSASALNPEAPELVSVVIAPNPVDISGGSEQITVTLHITDDENGFFDGNVRLYNPVGSFVRTANFNGSSRVTGDAFDGTYEVQVEIPTYARPGPDLEADPPVPDKWHIDLSLRDSSAHEQNYGPNAEEFPDPADRYFEVINEGTIDRDPPEIAGFQVSPVDVRRGDDLILGLQATDLPAGFAYGFTYVYGPQNEFYSDLLTLFDELELETGDEFDGTYAVPLTLPEDSPTGTWRVEFYVVDHAGNGGFRPGGFFTVAAGGTGSFSLGNAVDAVQHSWSSADPAWTYQTAVTQDGVDAAMSGPTPDNGESSFQTTVNGPGTLTFYWKVDSQENFDVLSVDVGSLEHREITGDVDWIEETIPVAAGEQTVKWTYAKSPSDAVGQDRGWVDRFHFTADTDAELPTLQSLQISPDPADIETGDQEITFTIEASDDKNGIGSGILRIFDAEDVLFEIVNFDADERISGDALQGIYEVTVTVPVGSSAGTWRTEIELVESVSSAFHAYGPEDSLFPNPGEELFSVFDDSVPDTDPPVLLDLDISPDLVDITAGAGVTTVTLRITDNVSGFQQGNIGVLTAADPNAEETGQRWTGSTLFTEGNRISGTKYDGIYQIEVPVALYGPAGTWSVDVGLVDHRGNERIYPGDPPIPFPGDETFEVETTGPVDLEKPTLSSIDFSPTQVVPGESITLTLTIADNLSGLRDALVFFYNPAEEYDGSFLQVIDTQGGLGGTYQFTIPIPAETALGEWKVRVFLRDRTGLVEFYGFQAADYPEPDDGKFTVSTAVPSVYDAFTTLHGLSGDDALRSADPDLDGFNNATELLLGTDPVDAASNGIGLITLVTDATYAHLEFTIDPELAVATDGNFLELGGGSEPFRLTGQTQANLEGAWSEVLPVLASGSTYRVSIPFGSGSRGFLRLFFEEP